MWLSLCCVWCWRPSTCTCSLRELNLRPQHRAQPPSPTPPAGVYFFPLRNRAAWVVRGGDPRQTGLSLVEAAGPGAQGCSTGLQLLTKRPAPMGTSRPQAGVSLQAGSLRSPVLQRAPHRGSVRCSLKLGRGGAETQSQTSLDVVLFC